MADRFLWDTAASAFSDQQHPEVGHAIIFCLLQMQHPANNNVPNTGEHTVLGGRPLRCRDLPGSSRLTTLG